MIVFEFDWDYAKDGQKVWYIGSTTCTADDEQHSDEIYQQLDAEQARLDE